MGWRPQGQTWQCDGNGMATAGGGQRGKGMAIMGWQPQTVRPTWRDLYGRRFACYTVRKDKGTRGTGRRLQ
eukprot:11194174-Lingulodinium_polyedra.AAC.1